MLDGCFKAQTFNWRVEYFNFLIRFHFDMALKKTTQLQKKKVIFTPHRPNTLQVISC